MLRHYPNVMQLRVRMPIDGNLQNPRNFITKIANYPKVFKGLEFRVQGAGCRVQGIGI